MNPVWKIRHGPTQAYDFIWPLSAAQRWSPPPRRTPSCCAERRWGWWRPERGRQWRSSCSTPAPWSCEDQQTQEKHNNVHLTDSSMLPDVTHAERETSAAGTTRTRLGRTNLDESHVTTLRPSRNLPGVAPPAPQMQVVWLDESVISRLPLLNE